MVYFDLLVLVETLGCKSQKLTLANLTNNGIYWKSMGTSSSGRKTCVTRAQSQIQSRRNQLECSLARVGATPD